MQSEVSYRGLSLSELCDELLEVVGKGDRRLYLAGALAGGASLLRGYHGRLTYTLTCDLHQSEFAQRKDLVRGSISLHQLHHVLVESLIVCSFVHIDEVDHDDASEVSQAYLPSDEVGDGHVYIEGGLLLPGHIASFLAA